MRVSCIWILTVLKFLQKIFQHFWQSLIDINNRKSICQRLYIWILKEKVMLRKLYIIITIVTLYYYYEIDIILLGGFNTEPTDTALYNLKNLIKDKTCLEVVT